MREVARDNNTTRFVKLHYDDAEMEVAGVPAVLAYRNGEKVAGLVPLMDELPDDSELTSTSLETLFTQSVFSLLHAAEKRCPLHITHRYDGCRGGGWWGHAARRTPEIGPSADCTCADTAF